MVISFLDIGSLPLIILPLFVEFLVLIRGVYTREPTDIVLATVSVPCLLVSMWAIMESLNSSGGVYWGELFSAAAGGLLLFLVVMDAAIGFAVQTRSTE
ncbi:hypothetical protein R3751_16460 [Halorubrum distributum]|uniref:hypothetical protein n=1 Tax=Halorubrum distributum TaxID=29283 RepID=UPI0029536522|nr:hypothetical protein [Halorubrum distributum]MDV7351357.1 hypothetical protein [Halorubrum distributum]